MPMRFITHGQPAGTSLSPAVLVCRARLLFVCLPLLVAALCRLPAREGRSRQHARRTEQRRGTGTAGKERTGGDGSDHCACPVPLRSCFRRATGFLAASARLCAAGIGRALRHAVLPVLSSLRCCLLAESGGMSLRVLFDSRGEGQWAVPREKGDTGRGERKGDNTGNKSARIAMVTSSSPKRVRQAPRVRTSLLLSRVSLSPSSPPPLPPMGRTRNKPSGPPPPPPPIQRVLERTLEGGVRENRSTRWREAHLAQPSRA
jgi:hypothetical protein